MLKHMKHSQLDPERSPTRMGIVIYRPGSEAESRPKPDVRCRAGTGPNGRPNKAHGPGSGFGMRLPQAQA